MRGCMVRRTFVRTHTRADGREWTLATATAAPASAVVAPVCLAVSFSAVSQAVVSLPCPAPAAPSQPSALLSPSSASFPQPSPPHLRSNVN
jgi:hypothetical protein